MKNILRITAVFSVLFFSCILLLCSGSQCGVSAAGNTPQYDSNGLYIEDGILKGVKDRDIYYLEIPEGVTEIAPYALGCMNRLSCPMMWQAMPSHRRWEWILSSSSTITRMYCPLFGTSIPAIFSRHIA